jgi:hypothetical protein
VNEEGESIDRSQEVLENIENFNSMPSSSAAVKTRSASRANVAPQGVNIVGIPKTIDKDLNGTDYTLGFDTALRNVSEVIERSRTPPGRMAGCRSWKYGPACGSSGAVVRRCRTGAPDSDPRTSVSL